MAEEITYGDVCGKCGGIIEVDQFGLHCSACEAHRNKNNGVQEWLKIVKDEEYRKASQIQNAIPELRKMGTYGKMLADKVIKKSVDL